MFQSNKRYFNVGSSIWFELTICWDNIIVSFAFRFSAFYSIIRLFLVISKTLRNIKWQTLQKQKRTKIESKVWQERGKKIDCVRKMKVLSLKIKKKKSQLFSVSIFDKIRLAHTHCGIEHLCLICYLFISSIQFYAQEELILLLES